MIIQQINIEIKQASRARTKHCLVRCLPLPQIIPESSKKYLIVGML